jgi:acetylornithine deacetylase/succinyl-diaminopimelate desuccinylase-like protein
MHSGVYGGAAGDALTGLCRLVATLHDEAGDVAVKGLHVGTSGAPDIDPAEWAAGAGYCGDLIGTGTLPDRLWYRPALSVIGLDAPAVSEASNVLLPRARAMLSLRIAPGDDPASAMAALTEHLTANAPWGAEVVVTPGASGDAFALTDRGDTYELARAAFADAYGNDVVEMGVGGSIPFIAQFARTYPGATVLVTGVGDPASRWHGIDESLHLGMWEKACLAEALLLERMAK